MIMDQEIHYDALGNIVGLDIPKYNVITLEDDLTVVKAERAAQEKQLKAEKETK